jgi:hypothetical protein
MGRAFPRSTGVWRLRHIDFTISTTPDDITAQQSATRPRHFEITRFSCLVGNHCVASRGGGPRNPLLPSFASSLRVHPLHAATTHSIAAMRDDADFPHFFARARRRTYWILPEKHSGQSTAIQISCLPAPLQ